MTLRDSDVGMTFNRERSHGQLCIFYVFFFFEYTD